MKKKKKIIAIVQYLLLVGFMLHILAVFQYIDVSLGLTSGKPNRLVLFGDVRLKLDTTMFRSSELVPLDAKLQIHSYVGKNPKVGSTIRFNDLQQVPTSGWTLFCMEILEHLLWLSFTFQLFSIVKSLKNGNVFDLKNVARLRWIALVVGISPVIEFFINRMFCDLLNHSVYDASFRYVQLNRLENFAGIFYMMLILLIIEVFRIGMNMKTENDLTI